MYSQYVEHRAPLIERTPLGAAYWRLQPETCEKVGLVVHARAGSPRHQGSIATELVPGSGADRWFRR